MEETEISNIISIPSGYSFINTKLDAFMYFSKTMQIGDFTVTDTFKVKAVNNLTTPSKISKDTLAQFDKAEIVDIEGDKREYNSEQFVDFIRDLNSITEITKMQGK